ncbi:cell cycle control protein 50A [Callorhinchus milii]|uniref:Cell cycle control protein n=1 Tax=Callorhinchus milii TaxID=7868 RepID=V9KFA9_CALMI|nr:cell cycle control protein 50A [Callorhinchus milii]|eukprot:gi/632933734/ref/XP_007885577.1/ PREDICTED: cell cycle control protein 50A [Callorhinchus milii]
MATNYSAKDDDTQHRSKKPDNTAFKQQRLPAWQPILTAGTVLPAFFIIGLVFIPIGIGLFVTSNNIREFEIDYTGTTPEEPCYHCTRNASWNTSCTCTLHFNLDQPFEGNVFMYYGLSHFYQNHRRYVKSRDDSQLNGDALSLQNPSKECEPYRTSNNKPIAPCGAIANSLFNDTLKLYYNDNGTKMEITLTKKGIAWWTDKNVKFRNPPGNQNLSIVFKDTSKPLNWPKPVYELDPNDPMNNGFINEDFIVWMRTAALPTFRKLYRLIKKNTSMTPTLKPGNYTLEVAYNYPVHVFEGRKRMILSTISWMGGKNPFLGIAYITVGSICFLLGIVLLIIHNKYGNRSTSADIPN